MTYMYDLAICNKRLRMEGWGEGGGCRNLIDGKLLTIELQRKADVLKH